MRARELRERMTDLQGAIAPCWVKNPQEIVDRDGMGINGWEGWALCDGRNDTPDLRDRFLLGAGLEPSSPHLGEFGGSSEIKLERAHLPKHNHDVQVITGGGAHEHTGQKTALADNDDFDGTGHYIGRRDNGGTDPNHFETITSDGSTHTHDVSQQDVGENAPIQFRPKFFGVLFMIKL